MGNVKAVAGIFEKVMTLILTSFFFLVYYSNSHVLSDTTNKPQATIHSSVKPVTMVAPKTSVNLKNNSNTVSHAANFDSAIPFVLRHEGGLANDKSDAGGITKYGISYRYLRGLQAGVTPSTIRNLTLQQAKNIYHKEWWNKFHFGSLNNQAIATKAFDFAVNMGEKPAIKSLQIAYNKQEGTSIAVNGKLDSQTISKINSLNKTQLHQLLYTYEHVVSQHYVGIAKAHPNDKKFLSGWLRRSNDNNF
jgi:lysozyme family protein